MKPELNLWTACFGIVSRLVVACLYAAYGICLLGKFILGVLCWIKRIILCRFGWHRFGLTQCDRAGVIYVQCERCPAREDV